jgi:hypothetical protein
MCLPRWIYVNKLNNIFIVVYKFTSPNMLMLVRPLGFLCPSLQQSFSLMSLPSPTVIHHSSDVLPVLLLPLSSPVSFTHSLRLRVLLFFCFPGIELIASIKTSTWWTKPFVEALILALSASCVVVCAASMDWRPKMEVPFCECLLAGLFLLKVEERISRLPKLFPRDSLSILIPNDFVFFPAPEC